MFDFLDTAILKGGVNLIDTAGKKVRGFDRVKRLRCNKWSLTRNISPRAIPNPE